MSGGTPDVVIVGGGIVGAACANALASEGLSVTIVESGVVGGGATAAGMGHVVVMDDSEAEFALTRYSWQLWQELSAELPPEAEYEPRGTIWVAADEEEFAAVSHKHQYYSERAVPVEVLDPRALREAEPHLRAGLAGGLLVQDDSVVYAPCAASWMIRQAQSRGAVLRAGSRAVEITGTAVRLADGTNLAAGFTVNAAGAWAPQLTAGLPIRPRKGHLAITDRYPGFVRHQLVELGYLKSAHGSDAESVAFNVQPRSTGQVLIGSSRQFGVENSSIDRPILAKMIRRAIDYMPDLSELSTIRTWTGFRAATDDKLPLIGPHPAIAGLYLATGHEGLGITTSLGTARLLADQILGREPAIPAAPYLPSRFGEMIPLIG
ncbi:MAG: FAD-dependent oxidoreductase [Bryobacterales bacterium]